VLVGSLLAGCSLTSPPDPFARAYGTGVGPWITRPGWQQDFLFGDATNKSHSTLTIDSVSLAGRGIGSVVTVSVMIARCPPRRILARAPSAIPGGPVTRCSMALGSAIRSRCVSPGHVQPRP
jgi:hypothetical protein